MAIAKDDVMWIEEPEMGFWEMTFLPAIVDGLKTTIKHVTNYQPVRNLGKRVGLFEISALSFANRGYAAAVSEQVGHLGPGEAPPSDQLPAARVVKRPR